MALSCHPAALGYEYLIRLCKCQAVFANRVTGRKREVRLHLCREITVSSAEKGQGQKTWGLQPLEVREGPIRMGQAAEMPVSPPPAGCSA